MRAKLVAALLLVGALLSVGAQRTPREIPVSEIGKSVLLIGQFGEIIGERVTIKGIKRTEGEGNFKVLSESGKTHDLWIDGIDSWPEGTKATFTGRERAFIRMFRIENPFNSNEDVTYRQGVDLSFKDVQLIAPANLKMDEKPSAVKR